VLLESWRVQCSAAGCKCRVTIKMSLSHSGFVKTVCVCVSVFVCMGCVVYDCTVVCIVLANLYSIAYVFIVCM
jgi:hypothetical protein